MKFILALLISNFKNMKQTKIFRLISLFLLIFVSYSIFGQVKCSISQSEFQQFFASKTDLDLIEGIWTTQERQQATNYDNRQLDYEETENNIVAIFRNGNSFDFCYFSLSVIASTFGTMFRDVIEKNGSSYTLKSINLKSNTVTSQYNLNFNGSQQMSYDNISIDNQLNIRYQSNIKYTKIFPTSSSPQKKKVSGTCFLINSQGYLATNYHVIKNAKSINIRGINENYNTSVPAEVLQSDANNDIAILKLKNIYNRIAEIKFPFQYSKVAVGTEVYVLGYPLRASMGDEIKLTSGIVSSNSGFQGDITTYQISAPVQPGNSGGPVFDKQGNIIGIVSSKHIGTENVSYAIKLSYLNNVLQSLPFDLNTNSVNKLSAFPFTSKVAEIKKFVYIIEVEE